MRIPNVITASVGRSLLRLRAHSPAIMLGAGVVGFVGTVVLAARATLKVEEVLDEIAENVEAAEEDRPAMTRAYAKGAVDLVVLYAPAVAMGLASTSLLVSSHGIMTRRNAAITAAFTSLEQGFNEYRRRVADQIGEDAERDLRYGIVRKEDIHPETGEKRIVELVDGNQLSPYARFFDELSPSWKKDPEYNLLFLRCQERYANEKLLARGHVFLNEVYDALGIPRSRAGAVTGWYYDGKGPLPRIDFGIYNPTIEHRMFVNGSERSILVDFNVDGVIYDKL